MASSFASAFSPKRAYARITLLFGPTIISIFKKTFKVHQNVCNAMVEKKNVFSRKRI